MYAQRGGLSSAFGLQPTAHYKNARIDVLGPLRDWRLFTAEVHIFLLSGLGQRLLNEAPQQRCAPPVGGPNAAKRGRGKIATELGVGRNSVQRTGK